MVFPLAKTVQDGQKLLLRTMAPGQRGKLKLKLTRLQADKGESDLKNESPVKSRPVKSRRFVPYSWTTWIAEGVLLIATAVGACYAWPIQVEAGRLHAKRLDLQRRVGEMPISDPAKYHAMFLKNENPMEFRWRIYVPEKTATTLTIESRFPGGASSSTSGVTNSADPALEGLVTVTLHPTDNNSSVEIRTRYRMKHSRGTSSMHVQDEVVQRMVNTQDISSWRVAGADGVETYSREEMIWLLAIETANLDVAPKQSGMIRIGLGTQEAKAGLLKIRY